MPIVLSLPIILSSFWNQIDYLDHMQNNEAETRKREGAMDWNRGIEPGKNRGIGPSRVQKEGAIPWSASLGKLGAKSPFSSFISFPLTN
jgi:hypothetical protein